VCSVLANTTVGNLLVLAVTCATSVVVQSVSDSQGNTWTVKTTGGGRTINIIHCVLGTALTTSDTISITYVGGSSSNAAALCLEFTGLTSTPADKGVSTGSSGVTSQSSGTTGTLSQANELVVAGLAMNSSSTPTVPSGFSTKISQTANAAVGLHLAYLVVTATTAHDPSWSWSGATNASASATTYKY
jgi:hypothetical protein